jgi:hypothetical protein
MTMFLSLLSLRSMLLLQIALRFFSSMNRFFSSLYQGEVCHASVLIDLKESPKTTVAIIYDVNVRLKKKNSFSSAI